MIGLDHILVQHANSMGVADYPAGASFGPRHCTNYEFVWIVSGDVEWIADDERYAMPAGSVCLCRPGETDSFIWDPGKRTRHGFIHFEIEDKNHVLGNPRDWPRIIQCGEEQFLIRLLNHVIYTAQADDRISQTLAVQGLKHALLCFIYERAQGVSVETGIEEHPIISKSMDYVRNQWQLHGMHSPAVEEIAAAIDVSRGHLVRIFKQELGVSPAQCLRNIRLDHAAMILARSDISVQDIAEECGFENQFHFSRAFKQQYKVSPKQYRIDIKAGTYQPKLIRAKQRRLSQNLLT